MLKPQAVSNYLKDVVDEAKKVVWPTRQQLIEHSVIVIGALLVALAIVALLDFGLGYLVKRLIMRVY